MATETIGFVGAGLMGHGMAKNILQGGYKLTVIANRNRAPIEDLVASGAVEAKSLSELAEASSIVFICAPGSPEVEAIVREMAGSLKPGSVVVDCSTSDPVSTATLARELEAAGHALACSSGSARGGGTAVAGCAPAGPLPGTG